MNEKERLRQRLVAELNRDISNLTASVERVSIEAMEMAGIVQNSFAALNSTEAKGVRPHLIKYNNRKLPVNPISRLIGIDKLMASLVISFCLNIPRDSFHVMKAKSRNQMIAPVRLSEWLDTKMTVSRSAIVGTASPQPITSRPLRLPKSGSSPVSSCES
jgi:hypothetical protein